MRIAIALVVCASVLSLAVLVIDKRTKQSEESEKATPYVIAYNISDLPVWRKSGAKLDSEFAPDVLIKYLQATIDPNSWGTDAEIRPFLKDGSLIISQTQANHEKVAAALAALRPANPREATERLGMN